MLVKPRIQSFTGTFKMTKAKTPIKHPKIVNEWMVLE